MNTASPADFKGISTGCCSLDAAFSPPSLAFWSSIDTTASFVTILEHNARTPGNNKRGPGEDRDSLVKNFAKRMIGKTKSHSIPRYSLLYTWVLIGRLLRIGAVSGSGPP